MKTVRNIALASGAALVLALGGALAQETKQPEQRHEHGDVEHAKNHDAHMQRMGRMHGEMRGMHERQRHGVPQSHGKQEQPQQEQSPR